MSDEAPDVPHGAVDVVDRPAPPAPPPVSRDHDRSGLLVGAVVAAVVGVGLWAAARHGTAPVVVVVAVVQAALIAGWIVGLRVPGRIGGLLVCGLAAAGSDVLAVRFPEGQLGVLLQPLGLLVLAIFVAQLTRGVVRVRVVESVSDVALLGVGAVALGSLIALQHRLLDVESALVPTALIIGVALAVSSLVDLVVPFPRFDPDVDRGLIAVLVGAAAGAAVGYAMLRNTFGYGPGRGAFLGAALGIVTCLILVGAGFARYRTPAERPAPFEPPVEKAEEPADPAGAAELRAEATDTTTDTEADSDSDTAANASDSDTRELGPDPATELVIEPDTVDRAPSPWPDRLRPVATTLWALAIAAPVGYLLTLALGG